MSLTRMVAYGGIFRLSQVCQALENPPPDQPLFQGSVPAFGAQQPLSMQIK